MNYNITLSQNIRLLYQDTLPQQLIAKQNRYRTALYNTPTTPHITQPSLNVTLLNQGNSSLYHTITKHYITKQTQLPNNTSLDITILKPYPTITLQFHSLPKHNQTQSKQNTQLHTKPQPYPAKPLLYMSSIILPTHNFTLP